MKSNNPCPDPNVHHSFKDLHEVQLNRIESFINFSVDDLISKNHRDQTLEESLGNTSTSCRELHAFIAVFTSAERLCPVCIGRVMMVIASAAFFASLARLVTQASGIDGDLVEANRHPLSSAQQKALFHGSN